MRTLTTEIIFLKRSKNIKEKQFKKRLTKVSRSAMNKSVYTLAKDRNQFGFLRK